MKKIAQIFGTTIQPYLQDWVNGLDRQDFACRQFLSSQPERHPGSNIPVLSLGNSRYTKFIRLMSIAQAPGTAFDWFSSHQTLSARTKLSTWMAISPLLNYGPDIIHLVNSYLYDRYGVLLSGSKSKLVVSFRGFDLNVRPLFDTSWKRTLTMIFNDAACLHFVSDDLMQAAVGLGAPLTKCVMIHPGIKLDFYKRSPVTNAVEDRRKIRLVSVGRLTWEKGYGVAIQAIRQLLDLGYEAIYQIVGEGPQMGELAFMIRQSHLQDDVALLGAQSSEQIRKILNAADIYIQPSVSEALGVAVLEASAMELPVICTRVGGLVETVEHDRTGMVVPPSNSRELAAAIVSLWKNPHAREAMGKAGREKVQRQFSLDAEVEKWKHLYEEIAQVGDVASPVNPNAIASRW